MHRIPANLIEKYNRSIPRYTSYPTVPDWKLIDPSPKVWFDQLKHQLKSSDGISLYIHLPYCESLCTYCGCNKRITKNHAVESSYIDTVLKEWNLYLRELDTVPVLKEVHLGGGTPTFFSPEELDRLMSGIFKTSVKADGFQGSFEAHPNSTTQSHLQTLYDLGFNRISVGVQDVSDEILQAINRQQTLAEVEFVTETARAIGYTSVNYDIIYGLPFQMEANIEKTIRCIEDLRPDRIAFYSYAHVPWKSASQRAFTLDNVPQGKAKYQLYNQGRERLLELGYQPVGMDHFCLPSDNLYQASVAGKMHRNFMGYTPQHTTCSIGLGASSISDCWSMYVQNEKTIEAYKESINNDQLPIIKGHLLSAQEMKVRRQILSLMCQNSLSNSLFVNTQLQSQAIKELIQDNLISHQDGEIKVSEIGQYFIRNICAAIDPQMHLSQTKVNKYSKAV